MFQERASEEADVFHHCAELSQIELLKPEPKTPRLRLSREDELYVWCLALKFKLVGKLAPIASKGEGSREQLRYECLVPDSVAITELNAKSDLPPISEDVWRSICKRFRHLEPPYDSFNRSSK